MHRYVSYLRSPRSRPLTIRQFNAQRAELLDDDRQFEHACLQAWQAGAQQRKRNVALTNAFPEPPCLRKAPTQRQRAAGTISVAQWGATPYQKQLAAADLKAMRAFAANSPLGVPQRLQHWIPACSARAVAAVVRQIDDGHAQPVMRLPASARSLCSCD